MTTGYDALYIIDYILETGAAWKGPIEQAYIIFRTPYLVNSENIRSSTTSGYQMLYHEVYWSFRHFEPTHDDNIEIVFVAPDGWRFMAEYQSRIETDPKDVKALLGLIYAYQRIAYFHGNNPNDYQAIEKNREPLSSGYHRQPQQCGITRQLCRLSLASCDRLLDC